MQYNYLSYNREYPTAVSECSARGIVSAGLRSDKRWPCCAHSISKQWRRCRTFREPGSVTWETPVTRTRTSLRLRNLFTKVTQLGYLLDSSHYSVYYYYYYYVWFRRCFSEFKRPATYSTSNTHTINALLTSPSHSQLMYCCRSP